MILCIIWLPLSYNIMHISKMLKGKSSWYWQQTKWAIIICCCGQTFPEIVSEYESSHHMPRRPCDKHGCNTVFNIFCYDSIFNINVVQLHCESSEQTLLAFGDDARQLSISLHQDDPILLLKANSWSTGLRTRLLQCLVWYTALLTCWLRAPLV